MNVPDAAYITGHDYPGGTSALGPRIGVSGGVLSNKLNPNIDTHHLTLAEAMRIMVMTQDVRILQAQANELGYMVVPLHVVEDETVTAAMTHTVGEFGEYVTAACDAMKDGHITKLELRKINKELGDMIAQAVKLQALLTQQESRHE